MITVDDPDEHGRREPLLDAIEELRDAGAEVIAINGVVRVVARRPTSSTPTASSASAVAR